MKDWIIQLAFLTIILVLFPFVLNSCIRNDESSYKTISLYDKENNTVLHIDLEEYLTGVVCAEMPAEFSPEALKSQAVAARTYTLTKINKSYPEHNGAELCTDFAHCQAYDSPQKCKQKWGSDYRKNLKKISQVVDATCGEYLEYNNEIALTVFHSCSNGITERASDVWGGEIPYLTNVKSPGDSIKTDYISKKEIPVDEFVRTLENELKIEINTAASFVEDVVYTSGNNVLKLKIFDHVISGVDIRRLFSLKSTAFTIEKSEKNITFCVEGNGHGVGMSQYGAQKMALDNYSYTQILAHYYPGTEIKSLYK